MYTMSQNYQYLVVPFYRPYVKDYIIKVHQVVGLCIYAQIQL